jgi:thioesterase family protein
LPLLWARSIQKESVLAEKSPKQVHSGAKCGILLLVRKFMSFRHLTQKERRIFMTLTTGIHGEQSVAVTNENTAKTMGSGTLDVFATPALVALAEKTCWMSVAEALDEGCGTVGTKLELEHTAPTPVGMTVTCESELVAVEGRKLVFKVSLHDEKGPVGGGTHERFVINNAKFAAKAESKKN